MVLEGLFKRLEDGVDVVDDFLHVSITRLFAFDELELSFSLIGRVYDELAAGPKCVSNRHDEVRSVVCWAIGCRKDVLMYYGMVCLGSIVSGLTSCRPSCYGCGIGWRLGEVAASVSVLCLLKFVTSLLPRSSPRMGHCPPFVFWSSWCRSRKVLLFLLIISFAVCLQHPMMWVLFRGGRHFAHAGVGPCFLLHLCT